MTSHQFPVTADDASIYCYYYFTCHCLAFTVDLVITLVSQSQYKYFWKNTHKQPAYPFSRGSGGAWLSCGTRGTLNGEGRRKSHNCTTGTGRRSKRVKLKLRSRVCAKPRCGRPSTTPDTSSGCRRYLVLSLPTMQYHKAQPN